MATAKEEKATGITFGSGTKPPAVNEQMRALKGTVTTFDQLLEEMAVIAEGAG